MRYTIWQVAYHLVNRQAANKLKKEGFFRQKWVAFLLQLQYLFPILHITDIPDTSCKAAKVTQQNGMLLRYEKVSR